MPKWYKLHFLESRFVVVVMEAFEAKKNVYFNYEFDELTLDEDDFPDVIYKSLVGLLYKHVIEYPDTTYCIYYHEELAGDELQKIKNDWMRYCPLD